MNRGKTILFIDNSNVFKGSRNVGWRIDIKKLLNKIQENGDVWQTFFFAAVNDPPRYSQTNFYNMLKQELHFETIIFPLGKKTQYCKKCSAQTESYKEKGVDVAIATKMLILANNKAFETAILLSGDKDYLETVKAVKNNGLRVEIVSWRNSLSHDLADESSASLLYLDDLRNEIEYKGKIDQEAEKLLSLE